MELIEKVARSIFRAGFHADEDETIVAEKWLEWPADQAKCFNLAKAAICAMLDGVKPCAWKYTVPGGNSLILTVPVVLLPEDGWIGEALYSLDALKEAR